MDTSLSLSQKQEINGIFSELLKLLDKAENHFKSARNWGWIDIFGGDFISTVVKHVKISKGSQVMTEISVLLERLQNKLSNCNFSNYYTVNQMSFSSIGDFLFDGLIFDSYVQSKIFSSLDEVRNLRNKIQLLRESFNKYYG